MTARDPYADYGMRGFIAKFARRNYWRVADWYDLDDLVQDGWLCYYKCRDRYVGRGRPLPARDPDPDHVRWMMSLVMTSFARHVHTLASRHSASPELVISQVSAIDESIPAAWDRIAPAVLDSHLIYDASREVLDLLSVLVEDARDSFVGFRRRRQGRVAVRETNSQREARLGDATVGGLLRTCLRDDGGGRVRLGRRAVRETTNEFYCRVLGLDPGERDVRAMIKDFLAA